MKKIILSRILLVFMFFSLFACFQKDTYNAKAAQNINTVDNSETIAVSDTKKGNTLTHSKINNICVCIKFKGESDDKFNQIYGGLSGLNELFNGKKDSLKSYLEEISHNEMNVNTKIYPNSSGKIVAYEDKNELNYYLPYSDENKKGYKDDSERWERERELINGAVEFVKDKIPMNVDFDADKDGNVDGMFFVTTATSDQWDALLWPHKTGTDLQINSKLKLEDYTIISDVGNQRLSRVMIHEYMHVLGFPDMYNYEGTFSIDEVGSWSIMSAGYTEPTIYEKYKYGGWINNNQIVEIRNDGEYSLGSSSNYEDNKIMAYKIPIPGSDEYLMLEYRAADAKNYSEELGFPGLLVYRVNPNNKGNSYGNPEVFVFRDGEYHGVSYDGGQLFDGGFLDRAALNNNQCYEKYYLSNEIQDLGIKISNVNVQDDKVNFNVTLDANKKIIEPENVIESKNNSEGITITWCANCYCDKYNIYRDGKLIGTSKTEVFTDKDNLIEGQKYNYQVTAYSNTLGESSKSSICTIKRKIDDSIMKVYYKTNKNVSILVNTYIGEYGKGGEYKCMDDSEYEGYKCKEFLLKDDEIRISDDDGNEEKYSLYDSDYEKCSIVTIADGKLYKGLKIDKYDSTTIYYKGFENPYIHYRLGTGEWTTVPGKPMVKSTTKDGYYEYTIPLKGNEYVEACFNNGNGQWDNNGGNNYIFKGGNYLLENQKITQISKTVTSDPLEITQIEFDKNNIYSGQNVKISVDSKGGQGKVRYKISSVGEMLGSATIQYFSLNKEVTWVPSSIEKCKIVVIARDESGNEVTKITDPFEVKEKTFTIKEFNSDKKSPQVVGSNIKLSAKSVFGSGTVKYKFYYKLNGKTIRIRDFSTTNYVNWKPNEAGTYSLFVAAKDSKKTITKSLKFIIEDPKLTITKFASSEEQVKVGESVTFDYEAINGSGEYIYSLLAENENGIKYSIVDKTKDTKATWIPKEEGKYKVTLTVTDEKGNTTSKVINVIVSAESTTTIYYKGYDNPYIHYRIGNGEWTKAPGVQMSSSSDVDGYYYAISIDLGDAEQLTACFNDGNGNWDSNGGRNYTFGKGYYTYSNGIITEIDKPIKQLRIDSITSKLGTSYVSGNQNIFTAQVSNANGKVQYQFEYNNKTTGVSGILRNYSEYNMLSTSLGTSGQYTLTVRVKDESGNMDSKTLDFTIEEHKNLEIKSVTSSLGDTLKKGQTTQLTINTTGGMGNNYYSIKVNGQYILNQSNLNTVLWTPTQAGKYEIIAYAREAQGGSTSYTKTITVEDKTSNQTTIYYRGYDNPYIHYKIGNGEWTKVPGVQMSSNLDVDGYYYAITIDLGDAEQLTACFNDGNGNWDSNGGRNYMFGVGKYTYSNGNIIKVN